MRGTGRGMPAPRASRRSQQSKGISKSSPTVSTMTAHIHAPVQDAGGRREVAGEHQSALHTPKSQTSVSTKDGIVKAKAVSRLDGRAGAGGNSSNEDRMAGAGKWRSAVLRPSPLVIPGRQRSQTGVVPKDSSAVAQSKGGSKTWSGAPGKVYSLRDRGSGGTTARGGRMGTVHGISRSPEHTAQRRRVPFDPSTPDSLGSTVLDASSPYRQDSASPLRHQAWPSLSPSRGEGPDPVRDLRAQVNHKEPNAVSRAHACADSQSGESTRVEDLPAGGHVAENDASTGQDERGCGGSGAASIGAAKERSGEGGPRRPDMPPVIFAQEEVEAPGQQAACGGAGVDGIMLDACPRQAPGEAQEAARCDMADAGHDNDTSPTTSATLAQISALSSPFSPAAFSSTCTSPAILGSASAGEEREAARRAAGRHLDGESKEVPGQGLRVRASQDEGWSDQGDRGLATDALMQEVSLLRHRLKLATAINEELQLSNADLEALLHLHVKDSLRSGI